MTGDEFKSIRQGLGLSLRKMGQAIGYGGNPNTVSVQIRRYESPPESKHHRPIPEWIARLTYLLKFPDNLERLNQKEWEQACGHLTDEEGNPLPRVTVKEKVAKFNVD